MALVSPQLVRRRAFAEPPASRLIIAEANATASTARPFLAIAPPSSRPFVRVRLRAAPVAALSSPNASPGTTHQPGDLDARGQPSQILRGDPGGAPRLSADRRGVGEADVRTGQGHPSGGRDPGRGRTHRLLGGRPGIPDPQGAVLPARDG